MFNLQTFGNEKYQHVQLPKWRSSTASQSLLDFRRPTQASRGKPETFDFLGFTDYWGKTHRGGLAVKKKTAAKKLNQSITAVDQWRKANRHESLCKQHRSLCQKLLGHYAYYRVTGNSRSLSKFMERVRKSWHKWLNRRSCKRAMSWQRFRALLNGPYALSPPRIVRHTENQLNYRF